MAPEALPDLLEVVNCITLVEYRIISNIGIAPIKAPPKVYPMFSVPILSALGHWK